MKKVLELTFVTFAIAALVTSVVTVGTAQTAQGEAKKFGKVVSDIAHNNPPNTLGPNTDSGDFCSDGNCNDGAGKAFGEAVANHESKGKGD